uniref:hypothetical protein n=1 Tax=Candidatus Loosdrechtia sp. TaxID=3101272 RepID=UPI00403AD1D5
MQNDPACHCEGFFRSNLFLEAITHTCPQGCFVAASLLAMTVCGRGKKNGDLTGAV